MLLTRAQFEDVLAGEMGPDFESEIYEAVYPGGGDMDPTEMLDDAQQAAIRKSLQR